MKIGIVLPNVGKMATRENVLHMAQMAEREGFDSVWVFERLLWPINPQSQYPSTSDGRLPEEYKIALDPLETLTFVAANTSKISLGTSVIDMLFHNPVVLARRLASLDIFSEGRAIAGFGIGWSKDEYRASNIPFNNKGKRADEYVRVLKKIWTEENVEFKGQYYSIPQSKIGPKPVQKPHMPIYLGGFSPNTLKRIVDNDLNGWLGGIGGTASFGYIENSISILRNEINQARKSPSDFKISLIASIELDDSKSFDDANRSSLTGSMKQVGSDLLKIKDLGVNEIIFLHNFSSIGKDVDKMIDLTKQLAKFAR
jgi:probable F420-dependent oxidoreductase